MLINSIDFAIFFAIVLVAYYTVARGTAARQNAWLLVASYAFYGYADWRMLPLLAAATVVFFGLGKAIASRRASSPTAASRLTAAGIVAGVGVLWYFKYLNFSIQEFTALLRAIGVNANVATMKVVMPIGISFFTFKLMSYVIEVRKGNMDACGSLTDFATYVAFFPTIMSGPIDRPAPFLGQLQRPRRFSTANASAGGLTILWGFFMKMCIADRISPYTDAVFNNCGSHNSTTLIAASLLYLMQMYTDFAGYSCMAIGVGRLLGINVTENFARPFFAQNVADFWRRWHMSLSSWLRDYIYIALGGNRRGKWRTYANLLITFVVCGIWHGANWTYIMFGTWHGLWVAIDKAASGPRKRLEARFGLAPRQAYRMARQLLTFLLCAYGAMMFRANSLADIGTITRGMWGNFGPLFTTASTQLFTVGALSVCILLYKEWRDEHIGPAPGHFMHSRRRWVRTASAAALIVYIALTGEVDGVSFIYFQF